MFREKVVLNIFVVFLCFFESIFPQTEINDTISISMVGDMMIGTDFPNDKLPPRNGKFLLNSVKPILSASDIAIGNLEGVILDGGEPKKKCKDTTTCYLFRMPVRLAGNFKDAGFNLLSLANNHVNDFGSAGKESTEKTLDSLEIGYSGRMGTYSIKEIRGVKIGFIAFSPSDDTNLITDIPRAKRVVKKLNDKCDILIVSFHGGAEGFDAVHVIDGMEIFYDEERGDLKNFTHSVIDAGADLVFGHGPHVPRGMEFYKDKLIAYSLGNFCNYKGFSIQREKGLAPLLNVKLDSGANFIKGKIYSAIQSRVKGTHIDRRSRAFKLIKKLTKEDFPNSQISFNNDGTFQQKKSYAK